MLQMVETLHSLNHWKTSFRTYYRRDSYFKAFLLPQATWSNSARNNYNQVADMNGTNVVRTAADKGEDLRDFLNTLAGYLPFPYLTEKIVDGSTNLQQVWDTIYDHYGVSVTSETLLDYATLKLKVFAAQLNPSLFKFLVSFIQYEFHCLQPLLLYFCFYCLMVIK